MGPNELSQAGFPVQADAYARLARFVELLLEENKKLNLTGVRDEKKVWPLHICDSLAIAPLIAAAEATRIVDLGSGGGIPGIPLACACPGIQITLIDATRKKIDATRRIIANLELSNVRAIWGRAETLVQQPELRESFDGLTARALAPLPRLIRYAAGFLRIGGRCWFSKSCRAEQEIDASAAAATAARLRRVESHRYQLPYDHGERMLFVYEKT